MTCEKPVEILLRIDQAPSRAGCPVLIALVVLLHVFASLTHAQSSVRTPPFALRAPHSAIANPYLFQGARYDAETGFYYFRNRHYDPRAGRFLQRDPAWDERNVGGWHTFVGNGPVSRRDPLGLNEDAALNEAVESYNRALLKYRALQGRPGVPPDELQQAREQMIRAAANVDRERALRRLRESQAQQKRSAQGLPPAPPQRSPPCPVETQTVEEIEQELEERGKQLVKLETRKKAWEGIPRPAQVVGGEWAGTRIYWGRAVDPQGRELPLPSPEEEAQLKARIRSLREQLERLHKSLTEEQASAPPSGKPAESCPPEHPK